MIANVQAPKVRVSLLLIDDDRSLGALLAEYCEPSGFSVTCARSGEEGIQCVTERPFQFIVLDVMLPGMDGFETLRQLREITRTPVLMLTTRGATRDRVHGLNDGADDYLTKPFQPEELVARIGSILRRTQPAAVEVSNRLVGDLLLDEGSRTVLCSGKPVELTGAQYELLRLLLECPGEARPREDLIRRIFGREPHGVDRSIDNLVNNLRKRLGVHPDGTDRFKSVRNLGYSYVLPQDGTCL